LRTSWVVGKLALVVLGHIVTKQLQNIDLLAAASDYSGKKVSRCSTEVPEMTYLIITGHKLGNGMTQTLLTELLQNSYLLNDTIKCPLLCLSCHILSLLHLSPYFLRNGHMIFWYSSFLAFCLIQLVVLVSMLMTSRVAASEKAFHLPCFMMSSMSFLIIHCEYTSQVSCSLLLTCMDCTTSHPQSLSSRCA
jgi:hypothetical protein